jgi:hypothetical protein
LRSANGLLVNRPRQRAFLTFQRASFVLVILLGSWCALSNRASAQNVQTENQSNIIRGTVVNALTNQPIGRALVSSGDNRYATLTDGEGHFEFTLPKVEGGSTGKLGSGGLTWLTVHKPGFLADSRRGGQTGISPGVEVTLSLTPEALIKGRVFLPAAESARGVDVELFWRHVQDGSFHWMQKNSVRTNSNGEFRFAELPAGTYKLLTREWMDNDPEATVPGGQLYGFPPVYYPSASDFAAASTIQLTAGETFEADMSLVRQPYYSVKIPVANAEPGRGMNITVSPQGERGPGYSLGYNGRMQIEGMLPSGRYLVQAEMFGPPNSSASGAVNIVVAGAPVEGPGMVLAQNNSIPVNVKEEFTSSDWKSGGTWTVGGRTFATPKLRLDLNVRAEPADDFGSRNAGSLRQPTGPNDDSMVLENLVPGRYWLRITAHRGYVASATMGGMDLLREPLVVVPGASTPIDITMRDDNAELEGTLLGVSTTSAGSGRYSPPGFIYCIPLPDSSGQFLHFGVSSNGKFDYLMVAPGVYRVIAFDSPQEEFPYRDAEAMKAYESKGQVVHFAPGQKVSLQLQVVSGSE